MAALPFSEIKKSHIDGNVPDAADFDVYLKRDLAAYFATDGMSDPAVTYELLRQQATQSGVAYPKYYAWVTATAKNGGARVGAVRMAAVERKSFAVTDFIQRETIVADPDVIASVFPARLLPAIRERAAQR